MRRFAEGMIVRFNGDDSLARITKITDKDIYYRFLRGDGYECRESIDFFSGTLGQSSSESRWSIVT